MSNFTCTARNEERNMHSINTITEKINATETQRATLAQLRDERAQARGDIERATAAAQAALDAGMPALEAALTGEATGEAGPDEVAHARSAIAAADKAVAAARNSEPQARELAAAVRGLSARIAALDEDLADLHEQHAVARRAADVAEGLRLTAECAEAGTFYAAKLAKVAGMQSHLLLRHGHAIEMLAPDWQRVYLPSMGGKSVTPDDFNQQVHAARAEADAAFGSTVAAPTPTISYATEPRRLRSAPVRPTGQL